MNKNDNHQNTISIILIVPLIIILLSRRETMIPILFIVILFILCAYIGFFIMEPFKKNKSDKQG
ncbi:hypothetical protein CBF32_06095 [Vagococcus fluvialis]|uniref:Uncharacterized protein n=1 Tax=Vagococcus fluvialis TaxID=2738 RepID=A0A430A742_9ENTE|nr:hypothetical protein CBF32_06095 [Vagococcus fluvialis]